MDEHSEVLALRRRVAELEAELEARNELADLYDNAPCGFHTVAPDGTILQMNATELRWLGYTREEVVGKLTMRDLVTPRGRQLFAQNFSRLAAEGRVDNAEMELRRRDGSTLYALGSAIAVLDAEGRFVRARATITDATEWHAMEQRLIQTNAALERAGRSRDEFLAGMSHELRTPLNAILGLSELLEEELHGPITPRQRATLTRIQESGRALLGLINDVLDFARVEAGKLDLDPAPINVGDLCVSSLRLVQEEALHKHLHVERTTTGELPSLVADERRMKQVLVNLLRNAIRFTPEGGSIGLEAGAEEGGEAVRLTVWDTGVGIAAEDMPQLFQPFARPEAGPRGGTGLGLALIRRIVDLHGGSVLVESEPGKGARFTVRLPKSRMPPPREVRAHEEAPRPSAPGGSRRVLLAEDDETNVAALRDFLQAHGYEVFVATNGREAITMARKIEPHVILMDVHMPVLDGLAATREIRADESPRVRRTPIVALTALAMPGDRERCLAAGADEYLAKPVSLKRLGAMVDEQLSRARA